MHERCHVWWSRLFNITVIDHLGPKPFAGSFQMFFYKCATFSCWDLWHTRSNILHICSGVNLSCSAAVCAYCRPCFYYQAANLVLIGEYGPVHHLVGRRATVAQQFVEHADKRILFVYLCRRCDESSFSLDTALRTWTLAENFPFPVIGTCSVS